MEIPYAQSGMKTNWLTKPMAGPMGRVNTFLTILRSTSIPMRKRAKKSRTLKTACNVEYSHSSAVIQLRFSKLNTCRMTAPFSDATLTITSTSLKEIPTISYFYFLCEFILNH